MAVRSTAQALWIRRSGLLESRFEFFCEGFGGGVEPRGSECGADGGFLCGFKVDVGGAAETPAAWYGLENFWCVCNEILLLSWS